MINWNLTPNSKLDALHAAITANQFQKIRSALVLKDGELIFEQYYNGADVETQHDVRSASKSITSALAGVAIEKGWLAGVDALIYPYFEKQYAAFENWDDEKGNITVRDFLTMSSCLECDDWNEYSRGNEERMYLIRDWVKFVLDLPIHGVRWTPEQGDNPPTYDFSYCTGGVVVLGALLEIVSGQTYAQLATDFLFGPLGITDYQWGYTPTKQVMSGGGLKIRARDMAKFGTLFLKNGLWNDTHLISEQWVFESTQPHVQIDDQQRYGYLWWRRAFTIHDKTVEAFYAAGNGGQAIYVLPSENIVFVTTSTAFGTPYGNKQPVQMLNDYILPALG
jgi:CubicO group peptidase (beta-lactamase class C family)